MATVLPELSDTDTKSADYDWFAAKVDRYFCEGCKRHYEFLHFVRKIIVWPTEDDPNMLRLLREEDDGGEVIRYEEDMGPCISYYELNIQKR